jgi:hypothetical protein
MIRIHEPAAKATTATPASAHAGTYGQNATHARPWRKDLSGQWEARRKEGRDHGRRQRPKAGPNASRAKALAAVPRPRHRALRIRTHHGNDRLQAHRENIRLASREAALSARARGICRIGSGRPHWRCRFHGFPGEHNARGHRRYRWDHDWIRRGHPARYSMADRNCMGSHLTGHHCPLRWATPPLS